MATAFGTGPARRTRDNEIRADGHRSRSEGPLDFSPGAQSGALGSLIEGEIIPRLLLAHATIARGSLSEGSGMLLPEEVERFGSLPLTLEADELLVCVEQYLARGVSVESILLDLLAPSARALGRLWDEDACDFLDVTMGLWRLQEVMRTIAVGASTFTRACGSAPSALFSPMPGEQHSFGSLLIEQVFDRAGWQTEMLIEPLRSDLMEVVAARPYDLVGLTISCDCDQAVLGELIAGIRAASKGNKVQVFIGGRSVNDRPGIAEACGADGTAADARSALALAERKVTGSRLLSQTAP